MTPTPDDPRSEAILLVGRDRQRAHRLFNHRHHNATPRFHHQIIDLIHSPHPRVIVMAFRGAAKSTLVEEAIIIGAGLKQFRNCLVIGENADRAKDRLRAIKHEFETNEFLEELFGYQVGSTWQEAKIVLSNGVVIQAHGQGQSLRGAKHLDARPDYAFVDDLESNDTVATKEAREKLSSWFYSDFLPALEPGARVRMAATPLDPEALAVRLCSSPEWVSRIYPVEYIDDNGARCATWPDRFPLNDVDTIRSELFRAGKTHIWQQEYMCRAVDPATRIFTTDMFRCEPVVRTYQPTFAIYDPARTTNKTSASTGRVIGSWSNNRLIIWEATAELWKPDEIVNDIFATDEKYNPVVIGVEEDGLHEFIMQPLRHNQVNRSHLLPIRPLKAPRGKLDFIRGLQPFFKAHEVVFAGDSRSPFEDAINQFLSFPTGRIDVPNAAAYLLTVRPGQPIYDAFSPLEHVVTDAPLTYRSHLALAVNATNQATTAILCEVINGHFTVVADFVRDGDAGSALGDILSEVRLLAGKAFTVYAPREHFAGYSTCGLKGAARSEHIELRRGSDATDGREHLRTVMTRLTRGQPSFHVSSQAIWTLRALSGGYARPPNKEHPDPGIYRTLMEGLEAFAGTLRTGSMERETSQVHYATSPDGRKYISAMGGQPPPQELKRGPYAS